MKSNVTENPTQTTRQYLGRRFMPPHVLIFLSLLLLYLVPLWLVSSTSYDKGGVLTVATDAHLVIGRIGLVYLVGFSAFFLGSWSVPKLCWLLGSSWTKTASIVQIRLYKSDYFLLFLVICAFIISKALLIGEGVYSNYAFDTGSMDSPVWTASMFLSEVLTLTSIVMLFSSNTKNVRNFFLLSLLNGINLLHGTRNFFVIALLAIAVYVYVRTATSLVKMALYGIGVFLGAVSLAYLVFIIRSHVADANFTLLDMLSPIIYESVFSQMALVALLNHPILITPIGSPIHLLQDVAIFSVPRILIANKGGTLWLGQFGYLSPMGAFNGFAAGLLYFGYFYALFYYFVGLMAGLLYRYAKSQYGAIVYLYFTCDFLYRIIRDGYIIPSKMLINALELVVFLMLTRLAHRVYTLNYSLANTGRLT